MDRTTSFGPLFVPAANFAGPLDGPSGVNIRTACLGYRRDGPKAKASNSNFERCYLKNYLTKVKNTFSKSDLYFPKKHTGQVLNIIVYILVAGRFS